MAEPVGAVGGRGLSNVAKGNADEHRKDSSSDNLGTPGKDVVACVVRGTVTLEIPTASDGRYAIVVKGPAEFHYKANGAVH